MKYSEVASLLLSRYCQLWPGARSVLHINLHFIGTVLRMYLQERHIIDRYNEGPSYYSNPSWKARRNLITVVNVFLVLIALLHMCNTDLSCYTINQQNSNTKFAEALSWHWFCNFTHLHEEFRVSNLCHLLVHSGSVWCGVCAPVLCPLSDSMSHSGTDRNNKKEIPSQIVIDGSFIIRFVIYVCILLHSNTNQTNGNSWSWSKKY